MKKANILIVSIFAALIIGVVSIFVASLTNFGFFNKTTETNEVTMKRYMAICTNPQMDGWQDVKKGLARAAVNNNAAIEFLEEGFAEDRADASCIEMAVDSGVDGIILYANDGNFDTELDYAAENFVPVVLVINDYEHDKIFRVTSDSRLLPDTMVDYISRMHAECDDIAVITSSKSEQSKSGHFRTSLSAAGRKITMRTFPGPHIFDANKTVKELIASENDVDMICCLDATATLGVAQSIVELNKVNVIKIVGSGKTDEILNMIQKGIIDATVAVDYEKFASEAIEILVHNASKPIQYEKRVLSDVYVIDNKNVRSFVEVNVE